VIFWNLPLAISGGDFVKKLVVAIIAAASLFAVMTLSATAQADKSAAISQLNMAGVPDLGRDNVRQVQHALQAKGFDPGPIDGVAGSRTKAAIRKFQDRFGMKASGEIDNQTLFALGKVELATGH
jgi:peptidoglycan hydrolase-like protein with peptidoglycan-binding domain